VETILIIPHNPTDLTQLHHILEANGYQVMVDPTGQAAFGLFPPSLVLLDMQHPDSFELSQRLQGQLFMLIMEATTDPVIALQWGARDYLTRPWRAEWLVTRIKNSLQLARLQQTVQNQTQQLEQANAQRQEAEQALQHAHDALEQRIDELSTLNYIIQTLISAPNLQSALQLVAQQMTQLFNVPQCEVALLNEAKTELLIVADYDNEQSERRGHGRKITLKNNLASQQVIESKRPLVISNAQSSPLTISAHSLLQERGTVCLMLIPLLARGEVIGTIGIDSNQPGREFTADELILAETIAGQIAGVVESARLFEVVQKANNQMLHELALAQEIQLGLLQPPHPKWSDIEVICYTRSAREVGGDFYTYQALTQARVLLSKHILVVGDVSGKGVSSALLMATCLSRFDAALSLKLHPAELLTYLDKALMPYAKPRGQNCALCCVEIIGVNTARPIIKVANAGCIPPYIKHTDGTVEELDIGGFALGQGLGAQTGYQEMKQMVSKGDIIILTSDGVVEAKNTAKRMFGFDRLLQTIADGPIESAAEMMAHLQFCVNEFMGPADLHDDLTIVVAKL